MEEAKSPPQPRGGGRLRPEPGQTAPAFRVTFLGTGSGTPSNHRNLPSVAVQHQGDLYLFDCGEAAQVQYRRAALSWGGLRGIAISHMHGDHVTGLLGLLMSLQLSDRTAPLDIWGPPGVEAYIRTNQQLLRTGFSFDLKIREESGAALLFETERIALRCAPLNHGVPCLGFRLEEPQRAGRFDLEKARTLGIPAGSLFGDLQRGREVTLADGRLIRPEDVVGPPRPGASLAYCTDTRPCAAAVELAYQVDLLIHEATYGADMAREAEARGHSTTLEAARVAHTAGARELVLTHISPRYTRGDQLETEASSLFPGARVASDLWRIEVRHRDE